MIWGYHYFRKHPYSKLFEVSFFLPWANWRRQGIQTSWEGIWTPGTYLGWRKLLYSCHVFRWGLKISSTRCFQFIVVSMMCLENVPQIYWEKMNPFCFDRQITFPKTTSSHLPKSLPKRRRSSSNQLFSGASCYSFSKGTVGKKPSYLVPKASTLKWLFQLDDSESLSLEITDFSNPLKTNAQTFRVPGILPKTNIVTV